MKESRRRVLIVAVAALMVAMFAATPVLADDGPHYGVIGELGLYEGLHLLYAEQIQINPQITDGGADEAVFPADDGEDGPFPDMGGSEVVYPDVPGDPDGGFDEGSQVVTETPDEPEIPDDGTDEGGEETTDTPDEPEVPDEGEESDLPSLPFTGGNAAGFGIAGLCVLVAGMLVLARGLVLRRS